MKSNYLIWDTALVEGACVLDKLSGLDNRLELNKGVRRAEGFPDDVSFCMNDDFPNDILLVDNLINTDMLIVVSKGLKEFVEAKSPRDVEYLPVSIIDHKGKTASADYFILNPVDPPDCLNYDESGAVMNPINKTLIDRVSSLSLREEIIEADRLVFRPRSFYKVTLIRKDLAEELDESGFVGNRWIELSKYPEE